MGYLVERTIAEQVVRLFRIVGPVPGPFEIAAAGPLGRFSTSLKLGTRKILFAAPTKAMEHDDLELLVLGSGWSVLCLLVRFHGRAMLFHELGRPGGTVQADFRESGSAKSYARVALGVTVF